jgi:hypothetical protein
MNLRSRVRALERTCASATPSAADCPVCHGQGGPRVRVFREALPGEPAHPDPPPAECPGCGRVAHSRMTIFLRLGCDPANPWRLVPPVHRRPG